MANLDELRKEINEIDHSLLELFERRMEIVAKVGDYKKRTGSPVLDESREKELLSRNLSYLQNKNLAGEAEEFFRSLMAISKKLQTQIIDNKFPATAADSEDNKSETKTLVGYQGVPGSYSEQALREHFGEVHTRNVERFEDVFRILEMGEIDYGILPIENSSTGGIAEVYDLLSKYGFYIIGERCLKVDHNLLAIKNAKLEDIREVYSHPQGLQQCTNFLRNYDWDLIPYKNTAISAQLVKEAASKSKAAIASRRAAEIYELEILQAGINDQDSNFTRFIIIGRNMELADYANKISIMVSTPHKPGALHRILGFFARHDLNMLKIESRPMKNRSWEYLFYIDLEGNLKNKEHKEAIQAIRKESTHFQLLGNYTGNCKMP